MTRRLAPKDKHEKPSWQRRNAAHLPLQQDHAAMLAGEDDDGGQDERQKGDDDGQEYADPRDARDGRE